MTVYSLVGHSMQQIGGECPDGWIEMECERPSADHVATEAGGWIVPVPTKSEKLKTATQEYNAGLEVLKSQTIAALMLGGESEAAKLASIRADLDKMKSNYLTKMAAIKAGEI